MGLARVHHAEARLGQHNLAGSILEPTARGRGKEAAQGTHDGRSLRQLEINKPGHSWKEVERQAQDRDR